VTGLGDVVAAKEAYMPKSVQRILFEDPVLLQRLAKYMVQQCFRNTVLEDFHCGITPDSATGDYSDVVVKSPYGEIPWPLLSRLSDEEMRTLMKDCVNKTYQFLRTLFDGEAGGEVILRLAARDLVPRWDDPE
jgi:hypothetical protein